MKNTMLSLIKYKCDKKECQFECFINKRDPRLIQKSPETMAQLDQACPECGAGHLKIASTNTKFDFSLIKREKEFKEQQAEGF